MNPALLVISNFFFMLGIWQLDHFVAPIVWSMADEEIEVVRLPYFGVIKMNLATFYNVCFICIFLGWTLGMVWGLT